MKKNVTKFFAGILLVAGAIGCSSENTNEKLEVNKKENQLQKKEELVFVNYRDIRDLNPHLYAGEMYAQEMLYETLVNIGPNGYEPCLAESWNISEDGKTYTFNIRKGVTFSDGTICDAHAIKANFDAILDEFDRIIDLDRLLVVHLNDSKNVQGAHKDRHANLGLGEIGFDILNGIAHNERIKDVPKILETPYIDGKAPYKEEIDMLKNQEFRNIEV